MYDTHQSTIASYGRANAGNMANVMKFVIVTIRNRFANVPRDMVRKDSAKVQWGFKAKAFAGIDAEAQMIYDAAEDIWDTRTCDRQAEERLLDLFSNVYGLGLTKGGFVVQLLYGVCGCIDSHNLERFNIDPKTIHASRFKSAKGEKRAAYIKLYCDYVEQVGGCESLWDSWCNHVAATYPQDFKDGEAVSALHCTSLGLDG